MNDTTLWSDNPLQFRKSFLRTSINEKTKAINNKIEQNKVQYKLDRQTVSALLWGNVGKYEFLAGKHASLEKDLLEKAAAIKRFEYPPIGNELNKQTIVAEKQYQKIWQYFEFN